MTKSWIRVDITCGAEAADILGDELAGEFGSAVEYTAEGVRLYFDSADFGRRRPIFEKLVGSVSTTCPGCGKIEWRFSDLADEDWSETWKAHFKPLRVGRRFLIAPTWEEPDPGPDDLVIRIDPGRAFGTGHHETTRLCLEWLEKYYERFQSLLDVGTGSGILAIGAAMVGFKLVVGIDNDPEAIEVAAPNIELNGLAGRVRVFCASPAEVDGAFDVVISNIQALPLIRMSDVLSSRVLDGGKLVLSGILAEQAEEVRSAFEQKGCVLTGSRVEGEWVLLEFAVERRISNGK